MAGKTFRVIRSGALPGARNMALDGALEGPTLRLYGWDPWTLSLGRFQRVEPAALQPFGDAGIEVTRRETGGGAILHGDEITYAVVLPADDPRIPRETAASYDWLHGALLDALAEVGVAATIRGAGPAAAGPDPFFCFARTAAIDLVARGRKIAGSAQRRDATRFVQHGSLPLTPNGTAPEATTAWEEGASDRAALEDAIVRGFERVLGATAVPGAPTAAEEERAAALERERYGNREWVLDAGGRETGPVPALPALPADPIDVLRAEVGPGGMRVLASVGGSRPVLPSEGLLAVDAATVRRVEDRPVAGTRDPWDSTFRRSAYGVANPEGAPPARATVEEETVVVLLVGAETALRLDARRFNFADLGARRTGEWRADLRACLSDLRPRVAGPGLRALLEGRPPPPLPGEGALRIRASALAASPPRNS